VPDCFPEIVDCPDGFGAQVSLEFCESHFDWVEIRAVRRQEQDPGPLVADGFFGGRAFVRGQIVHDNDIAFVKRGNKLGFNIGLKDNPVHRFVDDKGCRQPSAAQGSDEGLGFPVAEGGFGMKPFPLQASPAQTGHLGCRSRLINEHQPVNLMAHARLPGLFPFGPRFTNVGPVLFGCPQRFF
jgi:hypothetical protein